MGTSDLLVQSYSYIGDLLTILLCAVIICIIRFTYTTKDKRYRLLCIAIAVLITGATSNMLNCYVCKRNMADSLIYFTRDVYHICMLFLFVIFMKYLTTMIRMTENVERKLSFIFNGICFSFCFLDCISPITHYGLYREGNGCWHDDKTLRPFALGYIICMLLMVALMLQYRKSIMKKVLELLTSILLVGGVIVFIEKLFDSNTFLSLTYLFPILTVVFIFHSNTYKISSGSTDFYAFSNYLAQRKSKNKTDSFMCLKLYYDEEIKASQHMEELFYNLFDTFSDAELFTSGQEQYVLAIKDESNDDILEKILDQITVKFPKYYNEFKIRYRIIVMQNDSFSGVEEYEMISNYMYNHTEDYSYKIVNDNDKERYNKELRIVEALKDIERNADLNDERVVVYVQPIKNTETKKYDTCEALMRLTLPDMGMVFPDVFIPLAEEYGIIHTLSKIILNKTCMKIKELMDLGYDLSRISVNFSIVELGEDFIHDFIEIVNANNVPFEKVGVELTETQNDKDYEKIREIVGKLKELGVTIYLDDFGTGYSNFARILQLDLDVIKFDRSLLIMSDEEDSAQSVIDCFSEAFERLGYVLLYEGVETDEQEVRCMKCRASHLQGYKFSRPMPIDQLESFLKKNN